MQLAKGSRVRVMWHNAEGGMHFASGTYEGEATVHAFRMADDNLASQANAEQEPSTELIEEMEAAGMEYVVLENNPKIRLDDGTVRYGCQVWWTIVGVQS